MFAQNNSNHSTSFNESSSTQLIDLIKLILQALDTRQSIKINIEFHLSQLSDEFFKQRQFKN